MISSARTKRDKLLLLLLEETGFRIGEILGIKYTTDIDFENKKVFVRYRETNPNGAYDALPPDFYSDEIDIMVDIYRVNDSEIKKTYNPTMIVEKKLQQEIEHSRISEIFPQATEKLICIDKDWYSDTIHNINNYIKNITRVTSEHLTSKAHPNKIHDIWTKKHPNITRKGLVVYDETENYFHGYKIPYPPNQWLYNWTKPKIFYKPWMDKKIMQQIYKSDCDFLLWFMPYKCYDEFTRKMDKTFPQLVILDTRFPVEKYIEYDYSSFSRI